MSFLILKLSSFKVPLLEKLTSIFTSFFSTSLNAFFFKFLLFYLYNIFTVYFSGNSSFLKSYSSAISSFSYLLTSILSLFSICYYFFRFFKSFSFSYILFSVINLFHHTKYFITFSIFCLSICFLYLTTQLIFTTRSILIKVSNLSLTTLVNICK